MTVDLPRVALFADSFHEVNGVALTCRQFEAYARRHNLPFLSVHTGPETRTWQEGSITRFELALSKLSFGLERDLQFDTLFALNHSRVKAAAEEFQPDVVHVTGPSHIGFLGAWTAHVLRIKMSASWHTNVHEYAGRRLAELLPVLPQEVPEWVEDRSLDLTALFYRIANVHFAPNPDLCRMLEARTGKPCHLMPRGVDCELFSPAKRVRDDGAVVLGYVGRISPEKSVLRLIEVEKALLEAGCANYRFCIVGDGTQKEALQQGLVRAGFPGVLMGERLAEAYASMDVFLFPSETDTYGNVVQEAMACGVPCVVTNQGGPQYLVRSGLDGFVTAAPTDFAAAAIRLVSDAPLRKQMSLAARTHALTASWESVFDSVYAELAKLKSGSGQDSQTEPRP